jgi:DNA anti-recombination protein RmuC
MNVEGNQINVNGGSFDKDLIKEPNAPDVREPEAPSYLKDMEDNLDDIGETLNKNLEVLQSKQKEYDEIKREQEAKFEEERKTFETSSAINTALENTRINTDQIGSIINEQVKQISDTIDSSLDDISKSLNK